MPIYRGEMYRSTVWRTRLDTTTNWAVVTTGIALSVTFSSVQATPLPIVLVSFLLAAFLLFEARRYQYFDIWNTRLRVIESCFYDLILRSGEICTDTGWNELLADYLSRLRLHIGLLDAAGLRIRRNYGRRRGAPRRHRRGAEPPGAPRCRRRDRTHHQGKNSVRHGSVSSLARFSSRTRL